VKPKRRLREHETWLRNLERRLTDVEVVAGEARRRQDSHNLRVHLTPDDLARRTHPIAMAANDARNVADQAALDAGQALEAATTGAQIADGALKLAHEHPRPAEPPVLERPRAQDRYVLDTADVGTGWHGHGDHMGQHRHAWGHLPHDRMAHAGLDQNTMEHRQVQPLNPPRMPGWFRRLHREG